MFDFIVRNPGDRVEGSGTYAEVLSVTQHFVNQDVILGTFQFWKGEGMGFLGNFCKYRTVPLALMA